MDVVNADTGIGVVPAQEEKRTWYRWSKFPLLPMWHYRPRDEWNERNFGIHWLMFHVWTLSNPFHLEIEVSLDERGLAVGAIVPYLRVWVWLLPFPDRISSAVFRSRFYRDGTHNAD